LKPKNHRFLDALECHRPDQIPFIPAIYEHKAWFIGKSPSTVCRDAELLARAIHAEFEQVKPDALTVGIDVYNIEAEAAGCTVVYYPEGDNSIPAVSPEEHPFREGDRVSALKMPDPARDGRMPLNIEVACRIAKELGTEVPVRGALIGPCSLAAALMGAEHFMLLTLTDPAAARELLGFCAEVVIRYGKTFVAAGCSVVMFDSQASPELLSPDTYRELVVAPTSHVISELRKGGAPHVPLIIGGNTTEILDAYLQTGANNILCDFRADPKRFLDECSRQEKAYRRNIDSTGFLPAQLQDVADRAKREIAIAAGYPGFILGTAVVPYGTPLAVLETIREVVGEAKVGEENARG
jgi:uroporphyrinogen decarboxylase